MAKKIKIFFVRLSLSFVLVVAAGGNCLQAATSYQRLGEEAYAKFEYNKALDYFQKSIDTGSRRGDPWFFIGMIYEFQRKYAESIPYFEKAVTLPLEKPEYRQAALWKLVILHDREANFLRVIELVDQMAAESIYHDNLTALREKAYSLVSEPEEKLRARKFLAMAEKKENVLAAAVTEKEKEEKRREILSLLQQAASLDSDTDVQVLWKIAGYQEKLKKYRAALETYEKITERQKSPMALYKLAVVLKKLNEFSWASRVLTQLLQTEIQEQFQYYVYLNLTALFYAKQDFSTSLQNARKALSLKQYRIAKDKDSYLADILVCANQRQQKVFLNSDTKPNDTKTTQKEIESEEKTLKEKCHELYLLQTSDINREELSFFLLEKFLFEYEQSSPKEKNKLIVLLRQSLQLCEDAETCYPSWMHADLTAAAEIIFSWQEYLLLQKLLKIESDIWQRQKNYFLWSGESSFATGDFKASVLAFEKSYWLPPSSQKHYWLALTAEQNYYKLYNSLHAAILKLENDKKLIKEIFNYLTQQEEFEKFNTSEYFQRLKKEFLPLTVLPAS